jgi:hypothetical protein
MRKFTLALLAGGLLTGTASVALAQDVASAVPAPKSEMMVFTEKGNHALSPTAIATIRSAANDARHGRQITLSGNPANVAAVKSELVREGVPQNAIVARNDLGAPLPKAGDGLSDPMDRRVTIAF